MSKLTLEFDSDLKMVTPAQVILQYLHKRIKDDHLNLIAKDLSSYPTELEQTIDKYIADKVKEAEEHGYELGWNACVDECPDKILPEEYTDEDG